MEQAAKTWTGEWWKQGGGGSYWDGMAYDPDANLVYAGTGNGAVWSQEVRQGKGTAHLDNLYVASIIALNANTGELKWHYQATPGDEWDYDAISHLMLANLRINGRERKVIMQANKNGYFYVIDRVSGEFISAEPMGPLNWASGIDPKTGRPKINPEAYYDSTHGVSITPVQMHNTSQMAFNPSAGLVLSPSTSLAALSTFRLRQVHRDSGRSEFRPEHCSLWSPEPGETSVHRSGPSTQGTGRHYSERVGSRHSKRALVCGRRRQSLWRRHVHCEQSGFSSHAAGTSACLFGGQRRTPVGYPDRRNRRSGPADHIHAQWQTVRCVDGRSGAARRIEWTARSWRGSCSTASITSRCGTCSDAGTRHRRTTARHTPCSASRRSRTGACKPEAVRVRAALTANAAQIIFGTAKIIAPTTSNPVTYASRFCFPQARTVSPNENWQE